MSNMVQAPKVSTLPGATATVEVQDRRPYVAGFGRLADGPINRASMVQFQPDIQVVPEGFRGQVACRALDQGVLARIALDDIRLLGLHAVDCRETVVPKDKSQVGGQTPHRADIHAAYQVPEVATSHVEGEWLIPKDSALVVSLGAHTVTDKFGTRLRERVAVIESKPVAAAPTEEQPLPARHVPPPPAPATGPAVTWFVMPWSPLGAPVVAVFPRPSGAPRDPFVGNAEFLEVRPLSAPPARLTMPVVPSRTLPQGINLNGTVVLPPLPDAAVAPAADTDSAEPRPSPQTRPHPVSPGAEVGRMGSLTLQGRVVISTGKNALTADRLTLDLPAPPKDAVPDQAVSPASAPAPAPSDAKPAADLACPAMRCPAAFARSHEEEPAPRRAVIRIPGWRQSIELEIRTVPDVAGE